MLTITSSTRIWSSLKTSRPERGIARCGHRAPPGSSALASRLRTSQGSPASTDLTRCHDNGVDHVRARALDGHARESIRSNRPVTVTISLRRRTLLQARWDDSPADEDRASKFDLRVAPHAQCPPATAAARASMASNHLVEGRVRERLVVLLGSESDLDPAGSDYDHVVVIHRRMAVRGDSDVDVETDHLFAGVLGNAEAVDRQEVSRCAQRRSSSRSSVEAVRDTGLEQRTPGRNAPCSHWRRATPRRSQMDGDPEFMTNIAEGQTCGPPGWVPPVSIPT